jgi:hypothetical protein
MTDHIYQVPLYLQNSFLFRACQSLEHVFFLIWICEASKVKVPQLVPAFLVAVRDGSTEDSWTDVWWNVVDVDVFVVAYVVVVVDVVFVVVIYIFVVVVCVVVVVDCVFVVAVVSVAVDVVWKYKKAYILLNSFCIVCLDIICILSIIKFYKKSQSKIG